MTEKKTAKTMDKTTIYLIRHGTTAWNQQLRYQGRADNPLDEAGERQGALLENYFSDIDVDMGVTSPLQRAKKTLEYALASQKHPVPVIVVPGVTEIDFGEVDGLTREEIREKDPEFYRQFILNVDRGHSKAPGGESLEQVYCRMRDTILEIAREHQGETIVIASHGTAIQSFLNFASGIPWQEMKHFLLYNVSVSCVEIDPDGTPHIVFVGDRHHVPEDLAFCYSKPHAVEPQAVEPKAVEPQAVGPQTVELQTGAGDHGTAVSGTENEKGNSRV